jgi:hypothetical protein
MSQAERLTKVNSKQISAVCLGNKEIAGRFKWGYNK